MSPHAVISRNPETISTEIDNEVVLMSLITGRTFGLDSRGSRIWSLIEQPRTLASVVAELRDVYDVTAEKCEADVAVFLGALTEAQLATSAEPAQT